MTLSPSRAIELTVEKPVAGGAMLARVAGRIVLVTGAIPGERVCARIERVTKSVAFARTIEVVEPSADRREPFADPSCGGCVYSHIAYERQREIKGQVIADAFSRIGRVGLGAPVRVRASAEEGYRMRARLHVRGQRIGFFREGTHDICDARQSRQLLPATCDAIDRLAAGVRSLGADVVREVELAENVDASERVVHLDTVDRLDRRALEAVTQVDGFTPGPFVTDTLEIAGRRLSLRRHVLAFFQGNRYLLRDLVAHVSDCVDEGSAVADLYAGVGVFAVAAAVLRGASVVAVEGDRYAADDLGVNAGAVEGVRVVRGDVETIVPTLPPPAVAIVDPPRTGMSREALDAVLRLQTRRIIYISCDVATLARDARKILDAGYAMASVDAFDLFPNTPHVETVIVFDRR